VESKVLRARQTTPSRTGYLAVAILCRPFRLPAGGFPRLGERSVKILPRPWCIKGLSGAPEASGRGR
jgi:hypothetical protein